MSDESIHEEKPSYYKRATNGAALLGAGILLLAMGVVQAILYGTTDVIFGLLYLGLVGIGGLLILIGLEFLTAAFVRILENGAWRSRTDVPAQEAESNQAS